MILNKIEIARIKAVANKVLKVENILSKLGLQVSPGESFCCPFHDDNRSSAKLYEDNAFYCYACGVQFTPYRCLKELGISDEEIGKNLPLEGYAGCIAEPIPLVIKLQPFVVEARRLFISGCKLDFLLDYWGSCVQSLREGKP